MHQTSLEQTIQTFDPRSGRTWKRDCQKSPRRVEPRSAVMGDPWGATGYQLYPSCEWLVNGKWTNSI